MLSFKSLFTVGVATAALATTAAAAAAALVNIPQGKIRGVNLGGLFIVEPWMMPGEWSSMGCGQYPDEWTCMQKTNGGAQKGFTGHWENWITEADIAQIAAWNLNTIRLPLGHWIVEDTIQPGEPWARGGFQYLKRLLSWCNKHNIYVILDLHAAPQAQTSGQSFTGHSVSTPGFYNQDSFGRAKLWAWNITTSKIQDPDFANVFAIEVLNEPTQNSGQNQGLVSSYYPTVMQTIRSTEQSLGINCRTRGLSSSRNRLTKRGYTDCLNIMYMDQWWGAGDPTANLPQPMSHVIFDDHRYFAYNPNADQTRQQVLSDACNQGPLSQSSTPVMFGEFSLALSNENGQFSISCSGGKEFYQQYIASEISTFEKGLGWTFWTYKTETDFAWSYSKAVQQGIIPADATQIAKGSVC